MAQTDPAAVVLDLTALEYVHGDAIGQLAMELAEGDTQRFRPSAAVATGSTAAALQPLLEPEFVMGMAGMKLVGRR